MKPEEANKNSDIRKERQDHYKNKCDEAEFNPSNDLIKYRCDFQENIEDNNEIKMLLKCFGFSLYKIYDPPKNSQYRGIVYWYNLSFSEKNKAALKDENLWGFHIMPYCITKEDVENANPKIKPKTDDDKFRYQEQDYVDYDLDSGNFHKWPNPKKPQYQVVLIPKKNDRKAGGPGFGETGFALSGKQLVNVLTVKQNMYFPRIDSEKNYKKESLLQELKVSLIEAFRTVFKKGDFIGKLTEYENWEKKQNQSNK